MIFFYCSVCLEEYEDPRALPCLHTFCYKCLVQLCVKKVLDNPFLEKLSCRIKQYLSEISSKEFCGELKLTAQSANFLDNLLIGLDREIMFKCPLCTEKHMFYAEKGVAGYRKDFRINRLIDQHKTKWDAENAEQKCTLRIVKCIHHKDEDILFHCENEACKSDICQKCWADNHDKHTVTLISKKIQCIQDNLKLQLSLSLEDNLTRVHTLSKVNDEVTTAFATAQIEVNKRFREVQDYFNKIFLVCLDDLVRQKTEQQSKISEQMNYLCAQQDKMKEVEKKLNSETSPLTTANYQQIAEEMTSLNNQIVEWTVNYKKPQLSEYTIEKVLQEVTKIIYEDLCLDKTKIEQMGKRSDVDPRILKVMTPSPDKATDQTATLQTQIAKSAGKAKPVEKGQSKTDHLTMELETALTTVSNIETCAITKSNIYVTSNSHISCYENLLIGQVLDAPRIAAADASTVVISHLDQIQILVQLDVKNRLLNFISLETCLLIHRCHITNHIPTSSTYLTSCGHFLAYAFLDTMGRGIQVLSVERIPVDGMLKFFPPVRMNSNLRAIALSISGRGRPILYCTNRFNIYETRKHELALECLVLGKSEVSIMDFTFHDLDCSARNFDLRGIHGVGDSIYVLNMKENCMYHVLKTGKIVTKFEILNTARYPQFATARYIHLASGSSENIFRVHTISGERTLSCFKLSRAS